MVPIFPVLTHIGNFASANYCVSRWWAFISDVTNDWTLILLKCKKIYIIFHAHNLNLVNLTIITQNNTKINYICTSYYVHFLLFYYFIANIMVPLEYCQLNTTNSIIGLKVLGGSLFLKN